jgi:hypothetical protein
MKQHKGMAGQLYDIARLMIIADRDKELARQSQQTPIPASGTSLVQGVFGEFGKLGD